MPEHGIIVASDFVPAWWLRGPHRQTLWPFLLRRQTVPALTWERVELADGDFLDLCWAGSGDHLCLILHGLEGSCRSHYAPGLIRALVDNGWRVAFMHLRGCSGETNRLPRSYHSGETGDLAWIAGMLRQREQPQTMTAVGVSLGGNALLKFLGETGSTSALDAAVAVSVPFDLALGAARLERGLSRIYQWWLVRALKKKIQRKFRTISCPIRLEDLSRWNTFRRFDEYVTAPLHGFNGADDYYERSSSRQYLRHIARPTLLLQAADDPFLLPEAIPTAGELAPAVRLELSETGGHVGFVGGRQLWQPEYWLDRRVPEFLEDHKCQVR